MAPHDFTVAHAHCARRQNIIGLTVFQKLGADIVRQAHPAEKRQQHQQNQQPRIKERRQDNQEVQLRHTAPNLDKTLHQKVGFTAEITLHCACNHADYGSHHSQHQGKQQRIPETVNQARQQVAAAVVRSQDMPFRRFGRIGCRIKIVQGIGIVRIGQVKGKIAV